MANGRMSPAPGVGTGGAQGVKKNFEHGQIDGDNKQNRMQVKFSPLVEGVNGVY